MTNFERIKNMTVEEMAEFLEKNGSKKFLEMVSDYYCKNCTQRNISKNECAVPYYKCKILDRAGCKEWLESEAEE